MINVWDLATPAFFPDYYGELAQADPATRQGREVAGGIANLDTLIAECRARETRRSWSCCCRRRHGPASAIAIISAAWATARSAPPKVPCP